MKNFMADLKRRIHSLELVRALPGRFTQSPRRLETFVSSTFQADDAPPINGIFCRASDYTSLNRRCHHFEFREHPDRLVQLFGNVLTGNSNGSDRQSSPGCCSGAHYMATLTHYLDRRIQRHPTTRKLNAVNWHGLCWVTICARAVFADLLPLKIHDFGEPHSREREKPQGRPNAQGCSSRRPSSRAGCILNLYHY